MTRKRMKAAARKDEILAAALTLAETHGYEKITREQIAAAAGCGGTILHHYFGTMGQFRRDLMRLAITRSNLPVIAQGIAAGDAQTSRIGSSLRDRALDSLRGGV